MGQKKQKPIAMNIPWLSQSVRAWVPKGSIWQVEESTTTLLAKVFGGPLQILPMGSSSSFFFSFIFISWRLITLQYYSVFCHTLTWISHVFTCIPHPDPPSHLPLHPIPLGLPSAPGPSTCLMHPAWAGDLQGWDVSKEQHQNMYIIYSISFFF